MAQQAASYFARIDAQPKTDNDFARKSYGENKGVYHPIHGKDIVDYWYKAMRLYDFQTPRFSVRINQFTQLVWKSSREIGVGVAISKSGAYHVVVNYSPPGNIPGQYRSNVLRPQIIS